MFIVFQIYPFLTFFVCADPLPPHLNSYPSEARKVAFLSSNELFDSEAGRLRWKKESEFFAGSKANKEKGPRPGVWPPTVDWTMQQVESHVFSNAYDYESSWWQDALEALGKIRLQTVRTFEQDGTKRDYPVEYLSLDLSDGTWKSPADLGISRFPWRGKKRFMRLIELRLKWEELVDEFQVLDDWCRMETTRAGVQATRRYVHGEDALHEAESNGKTKGRNIAKRVVDWVNIVEELAGLRIEEFDPLSPIELQVKFSEVRYHNSHLMELEINNEITNHARNY